LNNKDKKNEEVIMIAKYDLTMLKTLAAILIAVMAVVAAFFGINVNDLRQSINDQLSDMQSIVSDSQDAMREAEHLRRTTDLELTEIGRIISRADEDMAKANTNVQKTLDGINQKIDKAEKDLLRVAKSHKDLTYLSELMVGQLLANAIKLDSKLSPLLVSKSRSAPGPESQESKTIFDIKHDFNRASQFKENQVGAVVYFMDKTFSERLYIFTEAPYSWRFNAARPFTYMVMWIVDQDTQAGEQERSSIAGALAKSIYYQSIKVELKDLIPSGQGG
jgi:hypothetical protein